MNGMKRNSTTYKTVRGYLSQDERQFLFDIAKNARVIINVGIEYGASIHCFVEGSRTKTKIVAIDIIGSEKFEGNLYCNTYNLNEYNVDEYFLLDFDLLIDRLYKRNEKAVVFIKGNSNTVPIDIKADVVFVDGCHWGKCFEKDIEKYSRLATHYLLFHDYSDSPVHKGVKETLDNWHCNAFRKIDQVDTIAVYKRKT